MRYPTAIMVAACLFFATQAQAESADAPNMGLEHIPVLAGTQYFRHDSATLGRAFHIHVLVPPEEDATTPLPVIYLLDGDQTVPLLASYRFYLTFAEEMAPAILVGISYGAIDPATNRRVSDFTGPAESNAEYGGADRFLDMLEHELMPEVERRYPADPAKRVLVGQSLGGQFVLHTALRRPGLFDLLVSVNPALHRNLGYYTEALKQVPATNRRQSLFVSSAEFDDQRFREPALAWMAQAVDARIAGTCLKFRHLPDETHLSSLPRAFRDAMRWHSGAAPACGEVDPELAVPARP